MCSNGRRRDFVLIGNPGDTVFLLSPISQEGKDWAAEHLDPAAMNLGGGIGIEHRYIEDILTGIEADGLFVLTPPSR